MYGKLCIPLLFTTVAQSSLALNTSDSCVPVTTIEADLATIQFGENAPRYGYKRFTEVIYTAISTALAEKYGEIDISEDSALRAALAQNETVSALLFGVQSTLEAMRVFQPNIDIPSLIDLFLAELQVVAENIFSGIQAAQGSNYTEAQVEIAKYANLLENVTATSGKQLVSIFLNGTTPVPDDADSVITCISEQVEYELVSAMTSIFEGNYILPEAILNIETEGAVEKYSAEIAVTHEKAAAFYDAEVTHKLGLLRNLVIADYLNKTGIVIGLFAIQSISGGNTFV